MQAVADGIEVPVPATKHVREVLAKAAEVGLVLVSIEEMYRRTIVHFQRGHYRMSVTFNERGYITSAGGSSPDANSWAVSVSGSRRFPCSPARALDVLVNHSMPRYAEVS